MSDQKHHTTPRSIAAIGPKDIISGFQALGADIFPARTVTELQEVARKLREDNRYRTYAVILVTASLVADATEAQEILSFNETLPTVVVIPDVAKKDSGSNERLKELTKRAIGFDIVKE